jgi:hypothetical protein
MSSCVAVAGPFPPLPFTPEGDDISAQIDAHRAEIPMAEHVVTMDSLDHAKTRGLLSKLITRGGADRRAPVDQPYVPNPQPLLARLRNRLKFEGLPRSEERFGRTLNRRLAVTALGPRNTPGQRLLRNLRPPCTQQVTVKERGGSDQGVSSPRRVPAT